MPSQSKGQKETVERVMHEYKEGELETGSGKQVKNKKQAIAIALREAGASKYESEEENKENLKRTKERERQGESSAERKQDRSDKGRSSERSQRSSADSHGATKSELYEEAKERDLPGRSKMSKEELARALGNEKG